jgi:UDP-N-acetyl-D-mannosaminuronic acid transferase (WecB/TagA/CpsF family)
VIAGNPGVVERAVAEIDKWIGGLDPIGSHDGYVASPEKTASAIDAANDFNADVVLVGMCSPIQEHWV